MGESVKISDLAETLKPFYQRAAEAETRLSRLESNSTNVCNEEYLKVVTDLQSKLGEANAELASEKEKVQILTAENAKLQYRIIHLLRALKEADLKLDEIAARDRLETMKVDDS